MKDHHGFHRPTIPVSYGLLLLEILEERGIPRDVALRETGIAPRVLGQGDGRLTPVEWVMLAQNAIRLTGDDGLSYEYGLRLRPSAHGFLGYAAMTGRNAREAVELAAKYFRGRLRPYQFRFHEEEDWAVVALEEVDPVPVLRNFFIECVMIGFVGMAHVVLGEPASEGELWFDWPEPPHYDRYRQRLPPVRFSQPSNQVRFPRAYLERRPVYADGPAYQQLLLQIEREYSSVRAEAGDVAARVRAELQWSADGYPDFRKLAARLGMSTRTLRRKLQAQETSFQTLLDEARQRDARHLLESSDLDVQTISQRVGFDNPANFTRAFKRWTGNTPREIRLLREAK